MTRRFAVLIALTLLLAGCGSPSPQDSAAGPPHSTTGPTWIPHQISIREKALSDADKAIKDYSEAIRLNPDDADAYYQRGYAYFYKKGEYDKAIKDFTEAIRLNPDYADAYLNRGNVINACAQPGYGDLYAENGEIDGAIKDFSEAIRLKPDDWHAFFNRAIAYRKKGGDQAKAAADFARAKELKAKK